MRQDKNKPWHLNRGCNLVMQALNHAKELQSAQDIYMWLRANIPDEAPALTTIYRSLDTLLKQNMIQVTDLGDGEKLYEKLEAGQHHHHLVCTQCNSSIHLDLCFLEAFAEKVEQRHGFKISSHILEMFGLCSACGSKQA